MSLLDSYSNLELLCSQIFRVRNDAQGDIKRGKGGSHGIEFRRVRCGWAALKPGN